MAFIANLMGAGVEFLACDQPFASRLTLHILAAVAEDEARRISERTKAALQAAKPRGRKLGSPVAAKRSRRRGRPGPLTLRRPTRRRWLSFANSRRAALPPARWRRGTSRADLRPFRCCGVFFPHRQLCIASAVCAANAVPDKSALNRRRASEAHRWALNSRRGFIRQSCQAVVRFPIACLKLCWSGFQSLHFRSAWVSPPTQSRSFSVPAIARHLPW